jgi:hypothetical protein
MPWLRLHRAFSLPVSDASQDRQINFSEQLKLHAAREGSPQIAASVQGVSAPSNISLVYEKDIPELLEVTCRPFEDASEKAATAVSFCDSGYVGVCIDLAQNLPSRDLSSLQRISDRHL